MVLVYFRSPPWFYGFDSLFEVIIIVTAFLISWQSYKIFTMIQSRRHKYFSIAFFLIGFAYCFKIFSNILLYKSINISMHNLLITIISIAPRIEVIHFYSFFFSKLLTVFGFLLLFTIAVDVLKKAVVLVMMYLAFLAVTLSSLFGTTVYHTILVAFLFFICWYYYNNHLRVKTKASYRTLLGFTFILIAQLIFPIDYRMFYVAGEIAMIIGFFILLYNQIKLIPKKR